MVNDIMEGSFVEFVRNETYVSDNERQWLCWAASVEKLLGHSLDGNQAVDGYSLDYAYAAFDAGCAPKEYVDEIPQWNFFG